MSNWYLSDQRLKNPTRIAPTASYNTAIFWSSDGKYLCGTDNRLEFVRLAVGEREAVGTATVITPDAWAANDNRRLVWRAWTDTRSELLYCLAYDQSQQGLWSIWQLSIENSIAERVLPSSEFFVAHVELYARPGDWRLVAFKPEARSIVVMGREGVVQREFGVQSLELKRLHDVSPCGQYLLMSVGGYALDQYIVALDLMDGTQEEIARGSTASWSPDGTHIAVASGDQEVCLVDWQTRHIECIACIDSDRPKDLDASFGSDPCFSPDGQWVLFTLAHWKRSAESVIERLIPQAGDLGRKWEPDSQPSAFVANLAAKTIVPLDAHAYHWAWRPKPIGRTPPLHQK